MSHSFFLLKYTKMKVNEVCFLHNYKKHWHHLDDTDRELKDFFPPPTGSRTEPTFSKINSSASRVLTSLEGKKKSISILDRMYNHRY